MRAEAEAIVRRGAPGSDLTEERAAFMRYRGQGHEISVALPARDLTTADRARFTTLFEQAYSKLYSRSIPGVEIEILSWIIAIAAPAEGQLAAALPTSTGDAKPRGRRAVFDPATAEFKEMPIYWRSDLAPGARVAGPAVVAEYDTSTIVSGFFDARIDRFGYIELTRRED
jgi:N-methylhydantoinase A